MSKINELLKLVDQFEGRKRIEFDDADDCNFVIAVFRTLKAAAPEIRAIVLTTLPTPVAESVQTPSSAEPTSPAVESSSHTQAVIQNTDGTGATTGQTADTSGKPASGAGMTIGHQVVVAAKAARGKRKQARLKAASEALKNVAPPAAPQATVGSETT